MPSVPIDISYEGCVLARGVEPKETPAGLFLPLDAPMPVGTELQLSDGNGARAARVARVHEGVGPGVFVALAPVVPVTDEPTRPHPGVPPPSVPPPPVEAAVPQVAPGETTARPPAPEKEAVPEPVPKKGSSGPLHDDGRITMPGIKVEIKKPPEEPEGDGDRNGEKGKGGRKRRKTKPF